MQEIEQVIKNNKIKKEVSIVVLMLSILLLFFTTFNFVYSVKSFCLGIFGFTIYPILLFSGLFSFFILCGKKFVYSVKYLIYLFLCFFFFVCILQIAFTGFSKNSNLTYLQYLQNCYNGLYTPGGAFVGVFTYPISSLLHDVAGIIFYAIGLIISLYFLLSYLQGVKEKRIVTTELENKVENKYANYERIANDIKEEYGSDDSSYEQQEIDDNELLSEVEEDDKSQNDEDDIFIQDEDKRNAREKLGLTKEIDNNVEEENLTASQKLFNNNFKQENWQNRAFNDRPQKFVENNQIKKANPLYEQNREYLNTLYQVNVDNPIINAEDYEDYKEKMKDYQNKNQVPFKRDLDVNQTLIPSEKNRINNIQNDNFKVNNFSANNNIINGTNLNNTNNFNQNNNFENDFIKPITNNDFNISPINPSNFSIDGLENIENKNNNIRTNSFDNQNFKPFDTTKLSSGDVSSSLGSTYSLNQQPSNVYNLPKGFNNNNNEYKQLEIIGTEKQDKEPKFTYDSKYIRPPVNLLETYINEEDLTTNHKKNIEILERVLDEFKIPAKVEAVRRGSAVTRYELRMPVGIPVRKIHQHASDIALALASPGEIRIEAPIKGKSAVGIEVPNSKIDKVGFKDIIVSNEFQNAKKPLTFALGKDIDGSIYCCDLASMPHLLVAGSTGSGKSVCLNALILSLIYRTSPEDLRLILVDPKRVEFAIYNGLPHLLMPKAITEPKKALNAFDWLINEMERRYILFQECYVKNITEYNSQPEVISKKFPKIPYIVLIVDELADLVVTTNKKELEEKIIRLTQKARAAGIHVILATQRPSVDIITGSIKINLPSRIAFAVTSFVDSKTILDQAGAEKLLGRGDMLYSPQSSEPVRVQGCFVDTPEVKRVVDFIKDNNPSTYDENVEKFINSENGSTGGNGNNATVGASSGEEFDSLMPDALKLVIENGQATISMLQRRFAIGFSRAARIIDQMELAKFISGSDGSKPRTVYITMDDYLKLYPQN